MTTKVSHHLQECQVSCTHIVKIDLDIFPSDFTEICLNECQALCFVVDDIREEGLLSCVIETEVILSSKQVDTHDAEDEPEDEADQQHVHDGGDGPQQRVHHNLGRLKHTDKLSTLLLVRQRSLLAKLERLFNLK